MWRTKTKTNISAVDELFRLHEACFCLLHTSAASICCLMSDGSTPGSSRSFTISWESRSVLSSAATSAQNFPARSKTSLSFPSLSSARCRISSHRERRRRRRERTAAWKQRSDILKRFIQKRCWSDWETLLRSHNAVWYQFHMSY